MLTLGGPRIRVRQATICCSQSKKATSCLLSCFVAQARNKAKKKQCKILRNKATTYKKTTSWLRKKHHFTFYINTKFLKLRRLVRLSRSTSEVEAAGLFYTDIKRGFMKNQKKPFQTSNVVARLLEEPIHLVSSKLKHLPSF